LTISPIESSVLLRMMRLPWKTHWGLLSSAPVWRRNPVVCHGNSSIWQNSRILLSSARSFCRNNTLLHWVDNSTYVIELDEIEVVWSR